MQTNLNLDRALKIILFIALLIIGLVIINDINIKNNSGVLNLITNGNLINITVQGKNNYAVQSGKAKLRLKEGDYIIYVTNKNNKQTNQKVHVYKGQYQELNIQIPSDNAKQDLYAYTNKFASLLPIIGPGGEFKITYQYQITSTQAIPTIVISSLTDKGKQDALHWIKNFGYNPNSLNLQYQTISTKTYNNAN